MTVVTQLHPRRAVRTGSYPLMNIAEDFGVDYGDVLLIGEGVRIGVFNLPLGRREQVTAAARRARQSLGDAGARTLYGKLIDVVRPV